MFLKRSPDSGLSNPNFGFSISDFLMKIFWFFRNSVCKFRIFLIKLVLNSLKRFGRPVGTVSTYFHGNWSWGRRVMTKKLHNSHVFISRVLTFELKNCFVNTYGVFLKTLGLTNYTPLEKNLTNVKFRKCVWEVLGGFGRYCWTMFWEHVRTCLGGFWDMCGRFLKVFWRVFR